MGSFLSRVGFPGGSSKPWRIRAQDVVKVKMRCWSFGGKTPMAKLELWRKRPLHQSFRPCRLNETKPKQGLHDIRSYQHFAFVPTFQRSFDREVSSTLTQETKRGTTPQIEHIFIFDNLIIYNNARLPPTSAWFQYKHRSWNSPILVCGCHLLEVCRHFRQMRLCLYRNDNPLLQRRRVQRHYGKGNKLNLLDQLKFCAKSSRPCLRLIGLQKDTAIPKTKSICHLTYKKSWRNRMHPNAKPSTPNEHNEFVVVPYKLPKMRQN